MQFYISPKSLKKQTKILVNNWSSPIKSIDARKILVTLYGYRDPHHYSQTVSLSDGSSQKIDRNCLLQNMNYFTGRLADIAGISPDKAQQILNILWEQYIPKEGFFPYYCRFSPFGILRDFIFQKPEDEESIQYGFNGSPSVKDAIEALGIPHTEIGAIIINGNRSDFLQRVQAGDLIELYPSLYDGVTPDYPIAPPGEITFVLDVHLGVLAKYLRMSGFDTVYSPEDLGDETLADISAQEKRVLLTRDIGLLKRSCVTYGYWVRNIDPEEQFKEIIQRYDLSKFFSPFTRCTECNGDILKIEKSEASKNREIPPRVLEEYSEFHQCTHCNKIYWKGSHFTRMNEFLSKFSEV